MWTKGDLNMKHFGRLILLIAALGIGGGLGTLLLPGFEAAKMMAFFVICGVMGQAFYQIDHKIFKK